MDNISVRQERSGDKAAIFGVHEAAFGRSVEAELADRLRASASYVPELSLVAEIDREIAGHSILTRATIEERPDQIGMLVLGPVGVLPRLQRQGVGSALIAEGLRRARGLGYGGVALIGHPTYYPRFGFRPGSRLGFTSTYNVPDEVFMVLPLFEGSLQELFGRVLFPPEFAGL